MSTLLVRGGVDVHGLPLDVTVVDGEISRACRRRPTASSTPTGSPCSPA